MRKQEVQSLKYLMVLLVMFSILVFEGAAQFTAEFNKPVTIRQESINLADPQITPQATTQDQTTQKTPQPSFPTTSDYKRIPTSQLYHTLFSQQINKISLAQTINATIISNNKEICSNSQPCQFYYYVIKPKFDPQQKQGFDFSGSGSVRNVFIVSGMHGNEFLGPTTMLYAVKYLETPGTRVILFPLANPSGYDHNQRLTYPTNIDPNRDFPIQQYKKCYQSSSSLIIDHIYRKYHIDLTLALHNGRSQIGWAWGTMRQRLNSHTKDQLIYRDIGEWLKFIGGKNKKLQMEQFSIGTINEVVYPVEGGFEDWAYAAAWYGASVSTLPTKNCNYLKFPFNMTNGLVFLFQLGPFQVFSQQFGTQQGINIHPLSTETSNGYISRAIRMLSGLVNIPNPRLDIKFTKEFVIMKLNGCKQGYIENMTIKRKSDGGILLDSKEKSYIEGSLANRTVEATVIRLEKQITSVQVIGNQPEMQTLIVEYSLTCDPSWNGNGNTIFGQKRFFIVKQGIILSASATTHLPLTFCHSTKSALDTFRFSNQPPADSLPDKLQDFVQQNSQFIVVLSILSIVLSIMVFVVFVICREIRKDRQERRIKRAMRRVERKQGEGVMSGEETNEVNQTTQEEIVINNSNTQKLSSTTRSKVQSYPHMWESDKSMKTQELGQPVQLWQFVKQNKHMIR